MEVLEDPKENTNCYPNKIPIDELSHTLLNRDFFM